MRVRILSGRKYRNKKTYGLVMGAEMEAIRAKDMTEEQLRMASHTGLDEDDRVYVILTPEQQKVTGWDQPYMIMWSDEYEVIEEEDLADEHTVCKTCNIKDCDDCKC